jgi:hypothetical protein
MPPAPARPRREPPGQQGTTHDGRGPAPQPHPGPRLLRPQSRRREDPNEAMRWLKRKLSGIVYKTMLNDLVASAGTGPGGHRGNVSDSSAAGSHPHTSSSDKSLPGPANSQPRTPLPAAS